MHPTATLNTSQHFKPMLAFQFHSVTTSVVLPGARLEIDDAVSPSNGPNGSMVAWNIAEEPCSSRRNTKKASGTDESHSICSHCYATSIYRSGGGNEIKENDSTT